MCAFAYLRPASVPVPSIPREFADETDLSDTSEVTHERTSPGYPVNGKFSPHIMDAICDLTAILNEVMLHNTKRNSHVGSGEDIKLRTELNARLQYWRQQLPLALDANVNFRAATCLLR